MTEPLQFRNLITEILREEFKYKLLNNNFHNDVRQCLSTARTHNIWNHLPVHVVDVDSAHYLNLD